MRPAWLVLSLFTHAAAIGAAVGLAVHAGGRRTPPPRVEVMPTVASVPAPLVEQPLPPLEAEPVQAEPVLPDAEVVAPIEPPPDRAVAPLSEPAAVPTLQRVVLPAPEPVTPAEAAPPAAELSDRVEAVRRADNDPPVYPARDRRFGHEGVVVTVFVDALGAVVRAELKTPCPFPGLNREALRAARGWRFEPARRHGQPVGSETDIEIEFRLRGPEPR